MFKQRASAQRRIAGAIAVTLLAAGCSSGSSNMPSSGSQSVAMTSRQSFGADGGSSGSVLKRLKKQVVIGSAVDPTNGASNPYGLTIAPATTGDFAAGDLVVCNFNGKSNKQGTGASIVALHPTPGSTPTHVSSIKALGGCDAVAMDGSGIIWAASMVANDNPLIDPTGKLLTNISGKPFNQPWGQVYAQPLSRSSAFYESNAGTGTVVRINLGSPFTYDVIAKGFPVNHGKPGTALAPSGLAYDPRVDTLYFADGMNNTIVAFKNVSSIPKGGIKATDNGMKFSGPNAADARIVFSGAPLNGPISTALLPNGNLVVGNTLDPDGTNLLIEISAAGKVLDTDNVDTGPAGSLFGIVATGTSDADTKVYFNDDNDNNVQVLER
jgi:sugar lactone lactonase YvrE